MLASGRCLLMVFLAIPILLASGVTTGARILIDDAPLTLASETHAGALE